MKRTLLLSALAGLSVYAAEPIVTKAPVPKDATAMFGGDGTRNMANFTDKNIPEKPEPGTELWKAELGSRAYGGPIVAGGKVFVGTNNDTPRNKRDVSNGQPVDLGVLMCFEEGTGKFLWQACHKKLESGQVNDWPREGVCSTPTVEGNRIYYVSNRCTVVCADVNGMADGNQGIQTEVFKDATDADIIWEYDMMKEAGVFPHNMSAGCPLIIGDVLYTITANGVDEGHINIPAPNAPSFIALDKNTGKLLWKNNEPGKNVMHGQWSNPVLANFGGKPQILFPCGDGVIYSVNPKDGEVLWRFDANPKESKYELGGTGTRSDFIGTPVVIGDKFYIGTGQDPEHFTGIAYFYCVEPGNKTGDISPELGPLGQPGKPNPNSAVKWMYGGADKRKVCLRDFVFGRTMSTACIVDDLIYISELQGILHCLDAKTGKQHWQFDTQGAIWGSPYCVDGKVYLANESGEVYVFKHDKAPKTQDELQIIADSDKNLRKEAKAMRAEVAKNVLLHKIEFDAPVRSTPVAANGVLYVMTEKGLHAFKQGQGK